MSYWSHNICIACWQKRKESEGRKTPVRLLKPETTTCCFCGESNKDGIFVRQAGSTAKCEGRCDY